MINFRTQKSDPVCGMEIESQGESEGDSIRKTYAGIDYWFCSEQCRQRFIDHPSLFIGNPKKGLSVKQRGKEELRAHYIHLKKTPDPQQSTRLINNISQLMGIKSVSVEASTLIVIYDLLQVSFSDIEKVIVESHCDTSTKVSERFKRTIIHFAEERELEEFARP